MSKSQQKLKMKTRKLLAKQQRAETLEKKKSLKNKIILGVIVIVISVACAFTFSKKQEIKEKIAEKAVEHIIDDATEKLKDKALEKITENFIIK